MRTAFIHALLICPPLQSNIILALANPAMAAFSVAKTAAESTKVVKLAKEAEAVGMEVAKKEGSEVWGVWCMS